MSQCGSDTDYCDYVQNMVRACAISEGDALVVSIRKISKTELMTI